MNYENIKYVRSSVNYNPGDKNGKVILGEIYKVGLIAWPITQALNVIVGDEQLHLWPGEYQPVDEETARKERPELFEEENPKFEIGEHAQIFKHRDVAGQRTAIFNGKVYRRNKAREWVISSQWSLKEAQWLIDRGFWIEINDRPEETESLAKKAVEVTEKEKAEFDKMTPAQQDAHIDKWAQDLADSMFNQSAINDGLPSDYVPPQAPRKAISYLYNDKQREEAERIDRARKRARFT